MKTLSLEELLNRTQNVELAILQEVAESHMQKSIFDIMHREDLLMGMSKGIFGFHPPNERWRRMKAVWDTCTAAGVAIPRDVSDFFGNDTPDESGVSVDLGNHPAVKNYSAEMQSGFEVDLTKLPSGLNIIRFVNFF